MNRTDSVRLVPLITAVLLMIPACGGGTANAPDPQPQPVPATDEVSEADLTAAGVPALPDDTGVSRAGSLLLPAVQAAANITSPLDIWNVKATADGAGMMLDYSGGSDRRIVGWAVYQIPLPESAAQAFNRAVGYQLTGDWDGDGGVSVFVAFGNFSTGKWEVGPKLAADREYVHYLGDGVFEGSLSLGSKYVSPAGNVYVLLAFGNPGSSVGNPGIVTWSGLEVSTTEWVAEGDISSIWLNAGGGDRFKVEQVGGDQPYLRFTETRGGTELGIAEMKYDDGFVAGVKLSFPTGFALTGFKGTDEELQSLWGSDMPPFWAAGGEVFAVGGVDGADVPVMFFNRNEFNGVRYPYQVMGWSQGDFNADGRFLASVVASSSAVDHSSGTMQGILLGGAGNDRVRVAGATMEVSTLAGVSVLEVTTGAKGGFSLVDIPVGEYHLNVSKAGLPDGLSPYNLEMQVGIYDSSGDDSFVYFKFTELE